MQHPLLSYPKALLGGQAAEAQSFGLEYCAGKNYQSLFRLGSPKLKFPDKEIQISGPFNNCALTLKQPYHNHMSA